MSDTNAATTGNGTPVENPSALGSNPTARTIFNEIKASIAADDFRKRKVITFTESSRSM
jgi:hypothetical protein